MAMLRRILLLAGLASWLSLAAGAGAVVELTDENFDKETATGVWMIKVYAPWCSHCRQLEPLWQVFAEEAAADGVKVGKIDGTKERAMMARLRISAFPSIFLLREGRTYVYEGARNVASFRAFATSSYQAAKPLPFHRAPNSILGRAMGRLHSLPKLGMRLYRRLRDTHNISDTSIVLGFLAVPVAVGGLLICCLDAFYVRRARDEFGPEHEHQE
ncbi:hypothetical protein HYH02_004482 [Chlamydomonas schloesseri]|uniref:Thioredoxin domain-containing protein n=1 Tax=Chlamydomonas schloesseri TaxID=2026947 RepID=A0A835WN00_9CHLO|nr:hypothetical protein HYH02_004482 [Chlamydomonas schloesseri]|eukprot:KAG2450642.1 hypothetical protein HYH02_004482 [Chlamydomonas schloesseri]